MPVPATPAERRVAVIVGGHFTPDALGPEYDEIVAAVRASPQEHLDAFEHLYLASGAGADRIADLHLPNLLRLLASVAPEATRHAAERLREMFAQVAHEQETEFVAATEADAANDVARRRRRLNARNDELRALLR